MPDKFTAMSAELHRYAVEHGARQDDLLRRLAAETEEIAGEMAIMQIAADQGAFITLLVKAIRARDALEIGTFTGYSAICIARGLPPGGRLVTCELSEDYAAVARRYIAEAGLDDRIEIAIGPALGTVRSLPREELFDFAFIDAEKREYPDYWEEVVPRLRTGGLAVLDNVFRDGSVIDPADDSDRARATREVNERIRDDERVDVAMIGVADGVTLALKR